MANIEPIVSIVVPVYNVEHYLEKCIASLLAQDYQDIEIILVNDGSTDESGVICSLYASKDDRVKVVNKSNGGLSSARNAGIVTARGEFIMFVDSDDFVEHDIVSYLLDAMKLDDEVDISTCAYSSFYEGEFTWTGQAEGVTRRVVMPSEALSEAMYSDMTTFHACFKLYRAVLFEDITFPEGKLYEDAGTTYKLISGARKLCLTNSIKYHYLQRRDSITGSKFRSQKLDLIDFSEELNRFVMKNYPEIINAARYYLFSNAAWLVESIVSSNQKQFSAEYERCYAILREFALGIVSDRKARLLNRLYGATALLGRSALNLSMIAKNRLKAAVK